MRFDMIAFRNRIARFIVSFHKSRQRGFYSVQKEYEENFKIQTT